MYDKILPNSEYALMNHPRKQAPGILEASKLRPAGFLGMVYGEDSQLSVADISRAIGIQDHRRFGQLFAERYGQTPGQFRKNEAS